PILPLLAMHEDRLLGTEKRHNPGDLFITGRNNSVHRHVYVLHSRGFHRLRLSLGGVFAILALAPQVNHGLHSQFGKLRPTLPGGLAAPINVVADLKEVRQARNPKLGRPGWQSGETKYDSRDLQTKTDRHISDCNGPHGDVARRPTIAPVQ